MNEDELRALAGGLFADEFLTIEGENTDGLYIERGSIEGGIIHFRTGSGTPADVVVFGGEVRDLFPAKSASRCAPEYAIHEIPAHICKFTRRARLRMWWRRHWWPARIRDLEAELREANRDLWGDW